MRLFHLTNIPTPYRVYFLNMLSARLAEHDIELTVIYMSWREPRRLWSVDSSLLKYKWINLRALPLDLKFFVLWLDLKFPFMLAFRRVDILLTAGSWNMPAALLSSLPLPFFPKQKIFWSEGHEKSVLNSAGIIAFLRKFALNNYNAFAVPSRQSRTFVESHLSQPKKFLLLPNIIDEDAFRSFRASIDSSSVKILAITAALEQRKGWIVLLQALRILDRSLLGRFILHVCGDGPLFQMLRDSLDELGVGVIFHGQRDSRYVANVLSKSHGFMLSSIYDPNPLSVIEALSVGLPLLVSQNCGNVYDCVRHNVNGWCFDVAEAHSISQSLKSWIIADCSRLREMGAASHSLYNEKFKSSKVVESFVRELVDLVR